MNLRNFAATVLVLLPCVCAAQDLPLCDISHPPSSQVELMSDTQGTDFGPYLQKVLHEVRQNWYSLVPPEATPPINTSGCVVIQFQILKDGTVAKMHYESSSGAAPLDRASWASITAAAPFWPLPIRFKGDHLELRFNFLYNPPPEALRDQASQATPYAGPGNQLPVEETSLSAGGSVPTGGTRTTPAVLDLSETGVIVPGRPIHREDPELPRKLRKLKVQGRVVLQATIEGNGSVSSQSVISGDSSLAQPTMKAVRQWKFEPYTQHGHPIKVQQNLTINFVRGHKFGELDPQLPPPSLAVPQLTAPQDGALAAGVFRVGDGVTAPRAVYAPSAQYDKQAKKNQQQGVCVVGLIVEPNGKPRDVKVVRSLGTGLDKKAIEAVRKWKFEPGTKDGVAVAVLINVEVTFRTH